MKKLIVIFLISVFSVCAYASAEQAADTYTQRKMTALMNEYHIPGAAVLLYNNGELSEYYYGYANKERKEPVIRKTIFELGSISKVMTGILFAQEIDWAKMSLTDPVTKYRKGLSKQFDKITLVDLATHTAGLPFSQPNDIDTQDSLNEYLASYTLKTAPGQQWIYSNLGIGILGEALEQSTEKDFDDLYRRHILNPLQMVNGVNFPKVLIKYYATGYDQHGNSVTYSMSGLLPGATDIKASAGDMQKFLSAAIGLPGTPPRVFYPMRMTQSAYVKVGNSYQGLGWEIHKIENKSDVAALLNVSDTLGRGPLKVQETYERAHFDGNALIDRSGGTSGFRAYIAVLPNKKSGIVILVNKNVPDRVIIKTARGILFGMNS